MNTRAKGSNNERKAVKILEEFGYLTYRVPGSTKFNLNVDVFHLFDIIALKNKDKRWIQVKTNRKIYGKQLEPFKAFKDAYCNEYDSVEIWVFYDKKKSKSPLNIHMI